MYREIFPSWEPGPERPVLAEGLVDIWRIDLGPAVPRGNVAPARPKRESGPGRALAQTALREILGSYLGRPAALLEILVHRGGKPYLATGTLEFNLSHCVDMALVAVTTGKAVGIDVEVERHVEDPLRLARRVLTSEELALLESQRGACRLERFLDFWTRMEARQKAVGHGIFATAVDPASLTSVTFRPAPRHWASLSLAPRGPEPAFRFFDYCRR
jgi:4'-phosphopantetheinyl transferase